MREYANSRRSCIQFPRLVAPMAKLLDEFAMDYPARKSGATRFIPLYRSELVNNSRREINKITEVSRAMYSSKTESGF